jgi:serralysin
MQGSTDNGVDRLFGLAGDDTLTGGGRNDHLDGGTGADQLDGGLDDDALYGGSGNDRLTGGRGSDRIDGGAGVDVAVFAGARADYTIETANGVTTITTVDWVNPYNPQTIRMAHDRLSGVERLQFSDQVVILRADPTEGTSGDDLMSGGAGEDALSGGLGADHLVGGAGDDELNGGLGDDVMDGGDGYDTVVVEGSAEDYRLLVDGDGFILKGADGGDRLTGIEMIRFSEGGEWDLARMYDGDEPQVMPMPGDFLVKDGSPETLPPLTGGSDGDLPMTLPPIADVLPAAAPGPLWRFALQDDGRSPSGGLGPDAEPARHWNWF